MLNVEKMSISRRSFIRQAACAAVGTTSIASTVWNLRAINAAAAQALSGSTEFRALVCLFLYGGNDANNMIVPNDNTDYAAYAAARTTLAIPQSSLLSLNPTTPDGQGRTFGLHPSMPELQGLFNTDKKLALMANVGTLVEPTTQSQFLNGTAKLPPQLFSHADQQVEWQTGWPDAPATSGWGGRMADLLTSFNSADAVSMSISLAGTNMFQVGRNIFEYQVSPDGVVDLTGFNNQDGQIRYQAVQNLLNLPHQNLFEAEFAKITNRAIANNAILTSALSGITVNTPFPADSDLSDQLLMIAKLIAARQTLGMRRQIFFCSVGGFDTHSNELTTQASLLGELSQCMNAFYQATKELGISDRVTLFTASDFSRTYQGNGSGADHAWGSHAMILGGSVKGGDIYGAYPTLVLGGPDDVGEGRWLPSTSVDEYSATLAKWYGAFSPGDLTTVLPNIGRFSNPDLGFLNQLPPPDPPGS
jgi:uncharacterized protein (DUF1501 family)